MRAYCYVRVANSGSLSHEHQGNDTSLESQTKKTSAFAEQQGFNVVNTGSTRMDVKILSMLTDGSAQLNEAVIAFRE